MNGEREQEAEGTMAPAGGDEQPSADAPAGEGALLDWQQSEELERHDRQHSGPGGEPPCPSCGTTLVRKVEKHRAPRDGGSPFRVRLECPSCRCWTVYDW